eukprot:503424_1
MGNVQSKSKEYMYMFGGEFIFASIAYYAIFWKLFSYFQIVQKKQPMDCLNLSTNIISTIHSFISTLALLDFFTYRRWEKPTIDEPRLVGHIIAVGTGYMFADVVAHLNCYFVYKSTEVQRRWDTIIHHILNIGWWFCCEWPEFIWGWAALSPIYGGEISTLFLNAQWFAKYFKKENLKNISQILFLITWFFVRVPIAIYATWWVIKYWKKIDHDLPLYSVIYWKSLLFTMLPLQIIWSIMILIKAYRTLITKKSTTKPGHLHGISLSFNVVTTE